MTEVEAPEVTQVRRRAKPEDPDERVDIILERSSKIPKVGLNVGHNGVNYLIKPGLKVSIPRKVLNVIKDAVMSEAVLDEDGNIIAFEERSAYPFRYV